MTNLEYHALPGVNASTLKRLSLSFSAYREMEVNGYGRRTKSMLLGSVVDAIITGGNAGLNEVIDECGITEVEMVIDVALDIVRCVRNNDALMEIVDGSDKQTVLQWSGEEPFTIRKGKPDFLRIENGKAYIYDLKTTANDVSPSAVGRTCWKYDYDLQLAWYEQGVRALYPEVEETECGLLMVSTNRSTGYDSSVIVGTHGFIEEGRKKIETAIATYIDGVDRFRKGLFTGAWPGKNQIEFYLYGE